ncbi:hypothetical protein [Streptomyces sp. TR02-1]|uniref:hypothetical protein n=1 Tax=Streptomyces sp. TR02-1 TaxID=3385977 RepID=UPI0039A1F5E8
MPFPDTPPQGVYVLCVPGTRDPLTTMLRTSRLGPEETGVMVRLLRELDGFCGSWGELSRRLYVSGPGMRRVLASLERIGLTRRQPFDGRYVLAVGDAPGQLPDEAVVRTMALYDEDTPSVSDADLRRFLEVEEGRR